MIIDDNLVLYNNVPMSGASGTAVASGVAVCLNAFQQPGLQDPIPVCIRGGGVTSGGITVQFQQASTQTGDYANVGPSWNVPASAFSGGRPCGPRYLPREVSKPWVKLVVNRGAAFSAGTLFAAIVREEDQRYNAAQQIEV